MYYYLKAGDHQVSLGSFSTEGEQKFSILCTDKYGRNSHELFNFFLVQGNLEIKEYIISVIITLFLEILLTIYMIINYIQRNKYINAIRKINGYSYIKRHNKLILLIVGTWMAILIGGYVLRIFSFMEVLKVIIPLALLEILIMYLVLKKIENDEILSVLKIK